MSLGRWCQKVEIVVSLDVGRGESQAWDRSHQNAAGGMAGMGTGSELVAGEGRKGMEQVGLVELQRSENKDRK